MIRRLKKIMVRRKKGIMAFGVIVLVIMIGLITPSFAISTPVSSITITSQNTSYENKEPGSWQVEKSGKWIEKGIAEVSFDVSTTLMKNTEYTDIIFVLDISSSMMGDKLERVKQDTTQLLESLLSNGENRAALITFDTESRIVSGLTNDKDLLIQEVNNLTDTWFTNYYQAFVNVDTILKDYQKEEDRDLVVLFLTDGYPNVDTPNQIAQYRYLKSEYPYITINGIQYEMGNSILDPIKEVSDNQFIADMETLNNVLFDASVVPILYDNFQIVDYIDNNYFTLENEDDITVSEGEVKLEEENGLQKITWTIPNYRSGSNANLSMDLKLKDELIGQGGVYPTNRSEQVISQIENQSENVNSTLTPALQESYQVIYEGNAPDGCSVENVPEDEAHSVFDVVSIAEEASCSGYEFKGWEIVTNNVTKVNDDYFIMPESDVILRAKWGRVSISKSMDGEISEAKTLYEVMQDEAVMDNTSSTYVSSSSGIDFSEVSSDTNGKGVYTRAGTENDEYPIYYYRGDINNNHVKFAGFCWKAVRTTSKGGVKLIYDGIPDSVGECTNNQDATMIGDSPFNSTGEPLSYSGYMYGDVYEIYSYDAGYNATLDYRDNWKFGNDISWNGSQYSLVDVMTFSIHNTNVEELYQHYYSCFSYESSCDNVYYFLGDYLNNYHYIELSNGDDIEDAKNKMFTNTNNSIAKDAIDTWYKENMTDYTNYLEDAVWCNDRSISSGNFQSKDGNSFISSFGALNRIQNMGSPSLDCSNLNDAFTVSEENGNGDLTYPIALLTADEVALAGGADFTSNSSFYLYNNDSYWTLSPARYLPYLYQKAYRVSPVGKVDDSSDVYSSNEGVRPAIVIKGDLVVGNGAGTSSSPYEILVD